MKTTICKKCGEQIFFIMLKSGKLNPVNLDFYSTKDNVIDNNTIVVNKNGTVGKLSNVYEGYISHFDTCPYSKEFKKPKQVISKANDLQIEFIFSFLTESLKVIENNNKEYVESLKKDLADKFKITPEKVNELIDLYLKENPVIKNIMLNYEEFKESAINYKKLLEKKNITIDAELLQKIVIKTNKLDKKDKEFAKGIYIYEYLSEFLEKEKQT